MKFERPEILYFLLLLLIPVLVHLFRWFRFKKIYFPNVYFLRQLEKESRKTKKLRQIILLVTRMFMLLFLIIGFAGPYTGNNSGISNDGIYVFLDRSWSTSYTEDNKSIRERLLKKISPLLDNKEVYTQETEFPLSSDEWLSKMYATDYVPYMPGHEQILTQVAHKKPKAKQVFYLTDGQFLSVSDFKIAEQDTSAQYYFILEKPDTFSNIWLDTLYAENLRGNELHLNVVIKSKNLFKKTDISIYLGDHLFSKSFINLTQQKLSDTLHVRIPLDKIPSRFGRIELRGDEYLKFDNTLYFHIPVPERYRVLLAGDVIPEFLKSLFDDHDIDLKTTRPDAIPWEHLATFDLVVFYGWKKYYSLEKLKENKDLNIIFIPSGTPETDLFFFEQMGLQPGEAHKQEKEITYINRYHPFFKDVFKGKTDKFKPPVIKKSYPVQSKHTVLLGFEDGRPFFLKKQNIHYFTAGISPENGDFYLSPFIVPVFYKPLYQLKTNQLYYYIKPGVQVRIKNVPVSEKPLHLVGNGKEIIPYAERSGSTLTLYPAEWLEKAGIYFVLSGTDTLDVVAFNIDRKENIPQYYSNKNKQTLPNVHILEDNTSLEILQKKISGHKGSLQKWFFVLAFLFLILELVLIKIWKSV